MSPLVDLRRFGAGEPMSASRGAAVTRTAFVAAFGAQAALALVVGTAVAWLVPGSRDGTGVLDVVLVALGALQGPAGLGVGLTPLPEPEVARSAALQRTILAGVLLSTPAWYLAFLIATGGAAWAYATLAGMLVVYGWLGLLLAMRIGARAVRDA